MLIGGAGCPGEDELTLEELTEQITTYTLKQRLVNIYIFSTYN